MYKIVCYGVRPHEKPLFLKYNKYDFDLTLIEESLTIENIETAKNHDAVLIRGFCQGDAAILNKIKEYGIKYFFTRSVGYNHIDLETAKELNLLVASVPGYSPNAIAELSLILGLNLLRNVPFILNRTSNKEMRGHSRMFSREIRNCTVGIVGVGSIGLTEARLYKGLGAQVLGYDIFESEEAKEVLDFVSLDELLERSDIVSLHLPHIPGENDEMINEAFISKMKNDAILVNTSRGQLQNNQAIVEAIKSNQLGGFATDVLPDESSIFSGQFDAWNSMPDTSADELINLYPRVLVTPHQGSNTDEAVSNMVEYSFENFNEIFTTGTTTNLVI